MAVFTWERITFRKTFRIAIQNVIGIVIWTMCVHMHCKCLPNHDQDLRTAREYFVPTALRSHVLESGFLRWSRSKTPFFPHFKTRFKSLIWNSFAFTRAKIRLSNQERVEISTRLQRKKSWSGAAESAVVLRARQTLSRGASEAPPPSVVRVNIYFISATCVE